MIPEIAAGTAERLRREFDQGFARPPEEQVPRESFLGIGLRGDAYALRVRQIASLLRDRPVVRLPTSVVVFTGLTTHRGALVPVYDLGMLLGYGAAPAARWLVLVRAADAFACLAFDRFESHFHVAGTLNESPPSDHLSLVPGLPDGRPVIDIPSIVERILHL